MKPILIFMLIVCQSLSIRGQLINRAYNAPFSKDSHKFIDIYTNYPNVEDIISKDKYNLFNKNLSRAEDSNEDVLNFKYDDKTETKSNFHPKYIKLHSEKYLDPEIPQNPESSNIEYESNTEISESPEYVLDEPPRRQPKLSDYSHVQKISRSAAASNSKQLEGNSENFFTKINTVIRNQFSRLFKFGKQPNNEVGTTSAPLVETFVVNPRAGGNGRGPPKSGKQRQDAKKRFLNIFTILQFENSRCQAQGGAGSFEGTCYHRLECAKLGGVSMGACAKGYGVCCIFRYGCDEYTNQNTSYFECDNTNQITTTTSLPPTIPTTTDAPDIDPRLNMSALINKLELYPRQASMSGTCVFTVAKRTPDVKQLRIDFLDFDLRGPTNGNCITDGLIITGGNTNSPIPVICGYNTGQHLYVDVSDVMGPVQLSVFTANPQEKKFRIRVSQIRAPCANFMNCLQYYTGVTGTVQTFNYDPSPRGLGQAQYFNNLNYAICVRKEPGYCSITYSNVQNGIESPFRLVNVDQNGNLLIPPGQAGAEIFNCPDDYIVINGIRLCGDRLNDGTTNTDFRQNAPVTDQSGGPFVLPVRTNGNTAARGFKLFYRQNRCSNT